MKNIIVSTLLFLASASCAAVKYGPHYPRISDVATILITDCKYDVAGIDVEFETGLPSPYVVAVFDISVAQFRYRYRPLHSVMTNDKLARLEGDFCSYGNSFVQVFTADITNSYNEISFVPTMTPEERREMSGGKFDFKLTPHPKSMDQFTESWGMLEAFYEGRSNMWPIKRLFTSMSASDGKVVALDWYGYIGYTPAPEGVPDNQLIPNGIKFNTKKGTNP